MPAPVTNAASSEKDRQVFPQLPRSNGGENAWAQVKIDLITSKASPPPPASTPSNALIVVALEDIKGRYTLIEKRIPVLQDAAKPPSYADVACQPPPTNRAPSEKFLPSRMLNEVTVQPLAEPAPTQTSVRVVEAVIKASTSLPGKINAARQLKGRDELVTTDRPLTKK
jgi:hypothetical protein